MSIESLHDLFLERLKDIYNAEQQIAKAIPDAIEEATRPELKSALDHHLGQTRMHIERLERIFEALGVAPKGTRCRGMEGILKEASDLFSEEPPEEVLDAAIIECCQHVEHYEIAAYGTLREYARQLDIEEAVRLLDQTLHEESETDKVLTGIAESGVNRAARDISDGETAHQL
jgi:ferritin-like metal-binding protein YciE